MDRGRAAAMGSPGETLSPKALESVYSLDVYAWMREMLAQWDESAAMRAAADQPQECVPQECAPHSPPS